MAMTFYTYEAFGLAPAVTCRSGNNVYRGATPLDLKAFEGLGGEADMVGNLSAWSGGLAAQGAQSGGAPAMGAQAAGTAAQSAQSGGSLALLAQADGDAEPIWVYSGTESVEVEEGVEVEVAYKVACYDEAGNLLDAAPADPGEYVALVRYTCPAPYESLSGDWTVRFSIDKRQVAVPTPAELTFKVANWETGAGVKQDAFKDLDDNIEFVKTSKTVDGKTVTSKRSAKKVGSYEACFRLKDPETCEWADGSKGSDEIWVRWSIAPDTYDPNSRKVMYWGTASTNKKTTVAYTGKPVWVRPWYTPAKASGGEFPKWLTHWGDAGWPTKNRSSACVVYIGEGMEDYVGIVGYHTNADGSLEPVTGIQVYAWMCGVDIDGKHVNVKSGQKVWYKVGKKDEVTVLAVGGKKPAGADGCVVARNLAYADKLGVMEPGTYQTFALFDEGTGFEAASLAETTVKVTRTSVSKAKVTLAKTSYVYDGKAKRPAVKSVKLNGKKLKAGTDYKVKYTNNVKAGKATVTVTGKGGYKGTAKATFTIKKAKGTKLTTAGSAR